MDKIIEIYMRLVDYMLSGVNAQKLLETLYAEELADNGSNKIRIS